MKDSHIPDPLALALYSRSMNVDKIIYKNKHMANSLHQELLHAFMARAFYISTDAFKLLFAMGNYSV